MAGGITSDHKILVQQEKYNGFKDVTGNFFGNAGAGKL